MHVCVLIYIEREIRVRVCACACAMFALDIAELVCMTFFRMPHGLRIKPMNVQLRFHVFFRPFCICVYSDNVQRCDGRQFICCCNKSALCSFKTAKQYRTLSNHARENCT